MTYVQSFSAVTPPPRYDDVAWAELECWESDDATETGTFALIDTQEIPVDATPATPNTVQITTTLAELAVSWYRFRFKDADGNYSNFTEPVLAPAGADGSVYFTVAELRAKYSPKLDDTGKYPDHLVAAAIARAEDTIERACDVAFVPRETTRAVSSLAAPGLLSLPHNRVRAVSAANGSSSGELDLARARFSGGYFEHATAWPAGETITVTYTHGYDEPPPRIRDAAMLYARSLILDGPIDKRATQQSTADGGVINLLTPGLRGSVTGIPEVDAAIAQYRVVGVG